MGEENKIKLTIGEEEREFTTEELTQGISENTELKTKLTEMKGSFDAVSKAAGQYGTDTPTYLESAESAFNVLNGLIESGIIDESGVALGKPKETSGDETSGAPPVLPAKSSAKPDMKPNEEAFASAVEKIIEAKLGGFSDKLKQVESSQSTLFKAGLNARIKAKHPEFSDVDVDVVLNNAFNDRTQDLWAHAEGVKASKTTQLQEQEKFFAKKFGINLEDMKKTEQLKEQRATGGIGALFKGKKFSFRKKTKNNEDFVRPSEAVNTFLRSNQ